MNTGMLMKINFDNAEDGIDRPSIDDVLLELCRLRDVEERSAAAHLHAKFPRKAAKCFHRRLPQTRSFRGSFFLR